jgi:hypothetical protein
MAQISRGGLGAAGGSSDFCRVLLSCFLAFLLPNAVRSADASQAWAIEDVYLGGDGGWNIDMAVDPFGQLHAGFYTLGGNFQYLTRQGGTWNLQKTFSNGDDLALDNFGRPSVLGRFSAPYNLSSSTKQDDGTWAPQTVALAPVSATAKLLFDSSNRPNIAYINPQAKELRLTRFNGSSWDTRVVGTGLAFRFGNSSFAFDLDNSDQAHFAWSNDASELVYAKPNGDSWQIAGVAGAYDDSISDLQVDAAGNVHLSFSRYTGFVSTGGLHYAQLNGDTWSVERLNGLLGFAPDLSKIAIDSEGNPHLFTMDQGFSGPKFLKHIYWANNSWQIEVIDQWTSNISGPEAISVAVGKDGFHVLYATGNENLHHAFLAVPEPSALALASTAFVALGMICRRSVRRR